MDGSKKALAEYNKSLADLSPTDPQKHRILRTRVFPIPQLQQLRIFQCMISDFMTSESSVSDQYYNIKYTKGTYPRIWCPPKIM